MTEKRSPDKSKSKTDFYCSCCGEICRAGLLAVGLRELLHCLDVCQIQSKSLFLFISHVIIRNTHAQLLISGNAL